MNFQTITTERACPQNEIAAYIDGELSSREELDLEMHFAVCQNCKAKLNEQKKLLCALDFALENEREVELPENFTKVVVATAESKVSGLRRPQERFKSFFVCAALLLLGVLGLGGDARTVLQTFWKAGDQFLAVGGFLFHLIYDFAIGTAIILRSLSHQIVFNSAVLFVFFSGFFLFALFTFSRLIVRNNRA
ncbi:MAG: zf-HC2 domain-containing protein [Acidobacteria bacterium]|nr:zf-HC2 domain-containing protein [Acidobacteriota bacterium]